jgi:NAD(P)H-hydrate epimerase
MNDRFASRQLRAVTGVLVPSVTAGEMRELDRIATDETGPTLLQRMENAGRSLASLAMELLGPRFRSVPIAVLAGSGGNGGGGICCARHLANHGANISLCMATFDHLSDAAAMQRKIFQSASGVEIGADQLAKFAPYLVVDALIGCGLRPAPSAAISALIVWANSHGRPILALDVPSGVDATTGEAPGEAMRPEWTLMLALPKTGLNPENSGQLFLADIGIPVAAMRRVAPAYLSPFKQQFIVRLDRADAG